MVLGISRYRGLIVLVSYYWILFNYARLHQFGEGYSAELSNTLIHSLKELMEIQSLVIQNKAFIQSDVSRIIYGIFSCSCSQCLSFWTSFLEENLCLCREMWKSFAHGDNLDFSLFECHCLRQFGLYGYFMWILDFARFMKLTSEESPPFTTDIDVIVFYLWYLRDVLIEWHIWILFFLKLMIPI